MLVFYYMTPPYKNNPSWTTAKYFGWLRSTLRRKWLVWPPRSACKKASRVLVEGQGRTKFNYKCSICSELFKSKEVEIDHLIPVGSLNTAEELQGFTERLYCKQENLRVLCKPCHKKVTAEQRKK